MKIVQVCKLEFQRPPSRQALAHTNCHLQMRKHSLYYKLFQTFWLPHKSEYVNANYIYVCIEILSFNFTCCASSLVGARIKTIGPSPGCNSFFK